MKLEVNRTITSTHFDTVLITGCKADDGCVATLARYSWLALPKHSIDFFSSNVTYSSALDCPATIVFVGIVS